MVQEELARLLVLEDEELVGTLAALHDIALHPPPNKGDEDWSTPSGYRGYRAQFHLGKAKSVQQPSSSREGVARNTAVTYARYDQFVLIGTTTSRKGDGPLPLEGDDRGAWILRSLLGEDERG